MMEEISGDTKATLLLCSRLGQTGDNGNKPLSLKQYDALARWLRERRMRPADLLTNEGREQLKELPPGGPDRAVVEFLLDRGAALGFMAERWASRGLWVIGRADASYPARSKSYLGYSAPPLLFGAGNRELLGDGGLAVVGSREATDEETEYARRVGSTCAAQGIAVISGGARGIDLEAMAACFEAGGAATGVLADSLARYSVSARYREGLISGRLVLVSPYDPEARWFAYTAMDRNKLIYGLSDAALVVTSAAESGGTWAGAIEALDCGRITVYVRAEGTAEGNRKLLARGAKAFPGEPWDDMRPLFQPAPAEATLFGAARQETTEPSRPAEANAVDEYTSALPALLAAVAEAKTEKSVAESLGLAPAQVKAWLKRACEEGRIRKTRGRYVTIQESAPLFSGL